MKQSTIEFSSKTIGNLKYYVYVYSDPDTHHPFYVGKGKGNRAFDHLKQLGESSKINKIKEIQSRGKQPLIEILIHGVDEEVALKVEAAAIDLIGIENLTNEQRGHHTSTYGKIEAGTLEARYSCEELKSEEITDDLIMIRINQLYRNDMKPYELYDITRGCWRVNKEKAKKAKYALAVYDGMILEAYTIVDWFCAGEVMWATREEDMELVKERFEFVGNIAPDKIRERYVNKSVASLFSRGNQNPIRYFIKDEAK